MVSMGTCHTFNPLAVPPCNGVIARREVDHLLPKFWCHTDMHYCILKCSILFYLNFLLNVHKMNSHPQNI